MVCSQNNRLLTCEAMGRGSPTLVEMEMIGERGILCSVNYARNRLNVWIWSSCKLLGRQVGWLNFFVGWLVTAFEDELPKSLSDEKQLPRIGFDRCIIIEVEERPNVSSLILHNNTQ